MKTLFFIAALAGAVYLIMQTPAGKAWLEESEPESSMQQAAQEEIKKVEQISTQVAHSPKDKTLEDLEHKITELAQRFNQTQQVKIDQLENRIAELENELENELVMGRIAKKQLLQSVPNSNVTVHPYQQPDEDDAVQSLSQNVAVNAPTPDTSVATTDNQLQRIRQARLQDIAEKMEMSSLQALVN